jgi:hypothetical protein
MNERNHILKEKEAKTILSLISNLNLLIHILKFFLSSVETFFNSGIIVDDGAQS